MINEFGVTLSEEIENIKKAICEYRNWTAVPESQRHGMQMYDTEILKMVEEVDEKAWNISLKYMSERSEGCKSISASIFFLSHLIYHMFRAHNLGAIDRMELFRELDKLFEFVERSAVR